MHLGQKCSYFYPIFIWLCFLYLSGIVTDAFSLQSRITSLSFRCGTTINTLNSGIEAKDAFTSMFLSSSTRYKSELSYTRPYIGFALSCVNSDSTFDDSDAEVQGILDMAMGEDYAKELKLKVETAMENDWDVAQGVNPSRVKSLPLQANLDLLTYSAKQQMLKGNFTSAEQLYQQAIDYNPCDGRAWLGMGRIHWKRGQALRAEKTYKDGLYYNPNNPFLLQGWAVMLEKIGKISEATKLLTKSVKSNPHHAASWVALARIHQRSGQVAAARDCYSSAVEGDPKSYVALQAWGVLEADCGNVSGARGLFRRALACSSKSVHTLQAWATLEKRAGNLEDAERLLGKALKAWPDSTRVRLSYAELYELQGDTTRTREVFQRGEKKAMTYGDAGFFQSWALFELRQFPGCYSLPSPATPYVATTDRNRDRTAGIAAVEASAAGLEVNKTSTEVARVHAIARRLFKKAVTVNKFHSASWVAWAKHEQRAGNRDVARRLLITGIANFPHSKNIGWFHGALASLAREDGDLLTARACYNRAVQATAPQQSLQVLLDYSKMEAYLGEKEYAIQLFETAVKRFPTHDRPWSAYIDFAASGVYFTGSSTGSSRLWVNQLEDRQREALKNAKREKNISNNRESLKEQNSDREEGNSIDSIDKSQLEELDRIEQKLDNVSDDNVSDNMGIRSQDITPSNGDLDFISKYERVGEDDCNGEEDGESGAIDRALKLLGLDGIKKKAIASNDDILADKQ